MRLAPGQQVTADLTLVQALRRGAMGSVWIADHLARGERVAVKFMGGQAARDPQAIARFRREAAAVAKLANPNVVRIVDHGMTDDGTPYLAMELLTGESLGERLERVGRLPMKVASLVLRSVGNALDAAHSRGIVHRDIKPDNVFLIGGDVPAVKVLDFGMAKQVREREEGEVTATGVAVGTPEYMSPEQVLGSKDVDHRSDLWALGALTFRMLAGRTPFSGDTPHALFFNICQGSFPPLHEVGLPLELEPWFHRVFAPKKDKRFGSAREMVLRFEGVLRELGGGSIEVAVDRLGGSFYDESTQLVDVERLLRHPTVDDEPSTMRGGAAGVRDELPPTHDLSALRLGDLDLLAHDEEPTFQLSPAEAAALHTAARALRDEDASPLPLLKPVSDRPSAPTPRASRPEPIRARPEPAPRASRAEPAPAPSGTGRTSTTLQATSGKEDRPRGGAPEPVASPRPEPDASREATRPPRVSHSSAEVLPHEIPRAAPPPRAALPSSAPRRGGAAVKVGLAAGVLVAGLSAAVIVRRGAEPVPAEVPITPRAADPPAAPPSLAPAPAEPARAAPEAAPAPTPRAAPAPAAAPTPVAASPRPSPRPAPVVAAAPPPSAPAPPPTPDPPVEAAPVAEPSTPPTSEAPPAEPPPATAAPPAEPAPGVEAPAESAPRAEGAAPQAEGPAPQAKEAPPPPSPDDAD